MRGVGWIGFLSAQLLLGSRAWCGIAISEIVVRPAAGEGEWIEIASSESAEVSVEGWTLRDGTGRGRHISGATLPPGGFLILAARPDSLRDAYHLADSVPITHPDGWPILNDHDGGPGLPADHIVLADAAGIVRDSLAYFEAWLPPQPGRSLERVDLRLPANVAGSWGWSIDSAGATPGKVNSLAAGADSARQIWTGPSEASPRVRPAVFLYRLPASGTIEIRLLDEQGREVALLQEPEASPAAGRWTWGPGSPLPDHPGLYVLCLRWQGGKERLRRCRAVWVTP
jgi:lamin tail-like protein